MSDKYSIVISGKNVNDVVFIKEHIRKDVVKQIYICIESVSDMELLKVVDELETTSKKILKIDEASSFISYVTQFLKLLFDSAEIWDGNISISDKINAICDLLEEMNSKHALDFVAIRDNIVQIKNEICAFQNEHDLRDCKWITMHQIKEIDVDYYVGDFIVDIEKEKILKLEELYKYYWFISPERYWLLHNNLDLSECSGIILGMSYLQRGINLERLKYRTSCLAAPAQDFFYDLKMLEYVFSINEGKNIKYCIQEIAPYRLWYDLSLSREQGDRAIYYYPQTNSMHHLEKGWELIEEYNRLQSIYNKIFEENLIHDQYMTYKTVNHWYDEKDTKIWANSNDKEEGIKEVKKLFDKPYEETFKENIEILDRIIRLLLEKEIIPIFVIPPYSKDFLNNMNYVMVDRTIDVIETIKRKYKDVIILNYLNDKDFDDYYFSDVSHLNYWGSNLLSDKLNIKLDEYIK